MNPPEGRVAFAPLSLVIAARMQSLAEPGEISNPGPALPSDAKKFFRIPRCGLIKARYERASLARPLSTLSAAKIAEFARTAMKRHSNRSNPARSRRAFHQMELTQPYSEPS